MKLTISLLIVAALSTTCSVQRQIGRSAERLVINDSSLLAAHVGISVFDPATNRYLYNYQGDKYFVPASNTKIPTCYAAMKYLGDSLVGLRYAIDDDLLEIQPSGDPTFLLQEFSIQKVFDFLLSNGKTIKIDLSGWRDEGWGSGWSWNDYDQTYMAERSPMPIYGNVLSFNGKFKGVQVKPGYFSGSFVLDSAQNPELFVAGIDRKIGSNEFFIRSGSVNNRTVSLPFFTDNGRIILDLLVDTLKKQVSEHWVLDRDRKKYSGIIYSQFTDSVLKPMMHRSDNFFAEQSLLMVSNEFLGVMNDARIIDTILKTDFKDLPQRPRWADGSGLSRYNLFTPQDFVAILNKMKNEFGMERIKVVFPTGGEGTISSYYQTEKDFIYAKTGTLSGVVALSGFLYTKKGKLLIFSTLVNNHQSSATNVRRAVEKFIKYLRESH